MLSHLIGCKKYFCLFVFFSNFGQGLGLYVKRNVTNKCQVTKQFLFQFWQIQNKHCKMNVDKILSLSFIKHQRKQKQKKIELVQKEGINQGN
jgi:hypothetical protein